MEVVDDTSTRIEEGIGCILATSLHNFALPFIRHDTDDFAEESADRLAKAQKRLGRAERDPTTSKRSKQGYFFGGCIVNSMHDFIKDDNELWDLFLKRNEYSLDRPERYKIYDAKNQHFNVLEPNISAFLIKKGMNFAYPQDKKFAVCLTHDVDDIFSPLSHKVLSSMYCIKNLEISNLKEVICKDRGIGIYNNFKYIMDLENAKNVKSSFYFLSTDKDIRRFRYNIEDLENELGSIVDNGCEVGLHGGYYSYDSINSIKQEKARLEEVLGRKVIGYRNHYLRFKVPDTWEHLAEIGFKYDTTFGYSDAVGFRNGLCHPFKPINLRNDKEIDILEIPLVIMDCALFSSSKNLHESWMITKEIIDNVSKCNGVLTLLWHNDIFNCAFKRDWERFYVKLLDILVEMGAWITNGEEIYKWVKNEYKTH